MFSRKGGQTGRRFVTEATLIYSSRRSLKSSSSYDRLNVSRDVTFPQNLKRLLRALILSCLIVCWRSYDKQTRVVVGGERGLGGGGGFGGDGAVDGNAFLLLGLLRHRIQMLLQITSLSILQRAPKCKSELKDPGFLFRLLGLQGYCTESD